MLLALRMEVEAPGDSVIPFFWLITTPRAPKPRAPVTIAPLRKLAAEKQVGFLAVSRGAAATFFDVLA
jgi:hypothetical protein